MCKVTDLEEVRRIAISLLYMDIDFNDEFPFLCSHPFTNCPYFMYNGKVMSFQNNAEVQEYWRNEVKNKINKSNLQTIFAMVNKPYKLCFIKFVEPFLSKSDFSELLGEAWIVEENPNTDVNVPLSTLVSWFKKTDKKALMQEKDYNGYCSLPEELVIYRGVGTKTNPNGLSWTLNKKTALWFANRFNNESGYILKTKIKKSDTFAYFNGRGEKEIVAQVSPKKYSISKEQV